MKESLLLCQVADLAQILGWLVHHQRPARTAKGWRTAILGTAGFPDLVMVHAEKRRVVFAELKSDKGRLSPLQQQWRKAIRLTDVEMYVWRPDDWPEIEETLRR